MSRRRQTGAVVSMVTRILAPAHRARERPGGTRFPGGIGRLGASLHVVLGTTMSASLRVSRPAQRNHTTLITPHQ